MEEYIAAARKGLYDQHGVPIALGDVVRVFHFTAALRRKKHYMFKQIVGKKTIGNDRYGFMDCFKISHLNMTEEYFLEPIDGRHMDGWEIIQSIKMDHDRRPKSTPAEGG